MENLQTTQYRGWDVTIYRRDDETIGAVFENEHVRYELDSEIQPETVEACLKKVEQSIDMYDTFDPQFRAAAFRHIDPPSFEARLIGEEK